MAKFYFILILIFSNIGFAAFSFGQVNTDLILVGGGQRPESAMDLFVQKAGGRTNAKILVIAWASEIPDQILESTARDLNKKGKVQIDSSLHIPRTEAEIARVVHQIEAATGIWATGGDQLRHMEGFGQPQIYAAIHSKFKAGTVVGGTSAGTAIMSKVMIVGESTALGLGLVGDGIILDQHFFARQRAPRLMRVLQREQTGHLGIGIDEDAAIHLRNGVDLKVLAGDIMILGPIKENGDVSLRIARAGERPTLRPALCTRALSNLSLR